MIYRSAQVDTLVVDNSPFWITNLRRETACPVIASLETVAAGATAPQPPLKETDMKITKDTKLAFVDGKGTIKEVVAEGRDGIAEALAQRAKPSYGMAASHVTNTTRKYQCNADLRYAKAIAKLKKEHDFGTDGAAIRLVMEAGLKALGFKELVAEVEADREASEEA